MTLILIACLENRPERDCKITNLVLSESDFPTGFVVDRISSPVAEYPDESAGRMASYKNRLIFHQVVRYRSLNVAKRVYKKETASAFDDKDVFGKSWVAPEDFSYTSPVAQQYHMACGNVLNGYQCRMTGQYEEYYVFFFAYVSDDGITLDIVEYLLQKIDHKMEQCLQTEE
jgi:hypothetical protein